MKGILHICHMAHRSTDLYLVPHPNEQSLLLNARNLDILAVLVHGGAAQYKCSHLLPALRLSTVSSSAQLPGANPGEDQPPADAIHEDNASGQITPSTDSIAEACSEDYVAQLRSEQQEPELVVQLPDTLKDQLVKDRKGKQLR
jgi:hypothetical protein